MAENTEVSKLPYCVHRYDDGSVCGKLAKNFWHLHSKVNDKRHHSFLSSETYALIAEQSEGALWWREALDELASSYEIQAVAASANGNDEIAEHYSNTAYGVRKAFEKLNLVEQRQPTIQAFRLSKSRIDKIVEDLIDGPVTLAAFDDGDGGETHIDRSACWAVFRANGIAVDE